MQAQTETRATSLPLPAVMQFPTNNPAAAMTSNSATKTGPSLTDFENQLEGFRLAGEKWEKLHDGSRRALYEALAPAYAYYVTMRRAEPSTKALMQAAINRTALSRFGKSAGKYMNGVVMCVLANDRYKKASACAVALTVALKGGGGWSEPGEPVPPEKIVEWLVTGGGVEGRRRPGKRHATAAEVAAKVAHGAASLSGVGAFSTVTIPTDVLASFDAMTDHNVVVLATVNGSGQLDLKHIVTSAVAVNAALAAFQGGINAKRAALMPLESNTAAA